MYSFFIIPSLLLGLQYCQGQPLILQLLSKHVKSNGLTCPLFNGMTRKEFLSLLDSRKEGGRLLSLFLPPLCILAVCLCTRLGRSNPRVTAALTIVSLMIGLGLSVYLERQLESVEVTPILEMGKEGTYVILVSEYPVFRDETGYRWADSVLCKEADGEAVRNPRLVVRTIRTKDSLWSLKQRAYTMSVVYAPSDAVSTAQE